MPIRHQLKQTLRRGARKLGIDIQRYRPPQPPALFELWTLYGVDAIFDVGANVGMSAAGYRALGFTGPIVSFEPVSHLFAALEGRARPDPLWHVERVALGETDTELEIRVSGDHGGASSLLEMTEHLAREAPDQRVVRGERVQVRTLDSLIGRYYPTGDRLFLKLDVQGFEPQVLRGAMRSLHRIVGMQVEMSLIRSYHGEELFGSMLPYLYDLGFRLMALEPGWSHPATREMYQLDGLFFRPDRLLA